MCANIYKAKIKLSEFGLKCCIDLNAWRTVKIIWLSKVNKPGLITGFDGCPIQLTRNVVNDCVLIIVGTEHQ